MRGEKSNNDIKIELRHKLNQSQDSIEAQERHIKNNHINWGLEQLRAEMSILAERRAESKKIQISLDKED